MKAKLILSTLLSFVFSLLSSQVPQGFNYQAIAREGGNPVITPIGVMLTIQSTAVGGTIFWKELHSGVQPNSSGLFTIVVGAGVKQSGTANTFNDIDWSVGPKYLKTEINTGSGFVTMGTSQFLSVPYSMVADGLGGSLDKLTVAAPATSTSMTEPLFEVKNNTGQTVFAVYNEGVRVYVDNGKKGVKGGFAIGGFGTEKAGTSQPLFIVNADSIRAYINPTLLEKGIKGGFAIGGFDGLKAIREQYLLVNSQSAQINMREPLKGVKAGFAIGSYSPGKADPLPTPFTNLTPENYFIGHNSGIKNTSGVYNSFIGYEAGLNNTTGERNVFLGYNSGLNNISGVRNVFIGNEAGKSNTSGYLNVFMGDRAGINNISGYSNVIVGDQAGLNITTGARSVLIGIQAGRDWREGTGNVFVGYMAGAGTTDPAPVLVTGQNNTFIGTNAGGRMQIGDGNVFVGVSSAVEAKKGTRNVLVGGYVNYAYDGNSRSSDTLMDNVYLGYGVAGSNYYGRRNVYIGSQSSGSYLRGGFTGSDNVFIGYKSGYNERGSNKLYIANSSTTTPLIGGDFAARRVGINRMPTTYTLEVGGTIWANGATITAGAATWSDARYKTDITPLSNALSDILKMQGVNYHWRQTEYPDLNFPKGEQIGVIAQDIEKILPEIVFTAPDGYKSVSYEKLTPVLIEAIKEQQQLIEIQQSEINHLKSLENEVSELKSLVNTLIANQAGQGHR